MEHFWAGFEKQASFRFGGYAMDLVRGAKSATPAVSNAAQRAARAATTAAKATKPAWSEISSTSQQALRGTTLGSLKRNITQI